MTSHRYRICRWLFVPAVFSAFQSIDAASAQVTYTVFPAVSSSAPAPAWQPVNPGAVVTLDVRDSSIAYVIESLVHQAGLRVYYNNGNPVFAKRITAHVARTGVMDALATVLRGTGLVATLASDRETVVVREASPTNAADRARLVGGIVIGRVTDSASRAGLSGAQVRVAGFKNLSAVTSDSGKFTLRNVPAGDQVLSVKLFGYKMVERTVTVADSERTIVNIQMVSVPTVLSGVVTTATGLQRKVEVGNDITTLNVDSIMKVAPITSVTDLLETRVPGLTVLHSSGTPGDPSRLRLRGEGSLQLNNDPIIIVNGVRVYSSQSDPRNQNLAPSQTLQQNPGSATALHTYAAPSPLDQIDPNNIATIEVFKGPSATAIYGSDAANGVIVITTKQGRAGPTQWSLTLGQGVNWLPGQWPVNYYRFGSDEAVNLTSGLCLWTEVDCHIDSVVTFQALNDPRYSVFSHGSDQTANLTVSGGTQTLQYSLTGSGAGDVGNLQLPGIEKQRFQRFYGSVPRWMLRPDNYQNWGVGGQLSAQPSVTTRVTLVSSLFNSDQQRSSLQQAIVQLEGEYINADSVFSPVNGTYNLGTSPLITNDVEQATDRQVTSTNALTLSWQPYSWLPLSATGGINIIQRTDNTYIPYGINYSGAGACNLNQGGSVCADTTGSYGLGRGTSQDNTLSVGTAIPLSRVTLALGANYHSVATADFQAYTNQLTPGVSQPTSFDCTPGGGANCFSNQTTSATSTYGWYVEPRLNFASRFFVAPGFKLDGGNGGTRYSSSTGSLGGVSAFPQIDFSWIAVDRQGARPLWGVFTLLRPRAAFGYAGTQPGLEDKLRLFNVGQYTLSAPNGVGSNLAVYNSNYCQSTVTLDAGVTTVPAVCLNSVGNTQLRPERSSELQGGFDATLWQGRLTLTYTQYDKTRHDAILAIPIAPSVVSLNGAPAQYEKNIGVIRNTGTEVTVNAFVFQSRALSWNVGANLSNDNNLVVRLNPGQAPFCLDGSFTQSGGECIKPGYPLFGAWAVPIVFFADANHDGVIEPNEIRLADSAVFLGRTNPKYQFNLNTGLTLLNGRLSVNATFAYQNGLTQTNQGALSSGAFLALPNAPNTPLATQAALVADCSSLRIFVGGNSNNGCNNGFSIIGLTQNVNTFRFSSLSINYELPKTVSTLFRVPRMTLVLQGSNLGLHTNYRGKDPDVNAFSTVSAGDETEDLGEVPEPRTWWLKVTMGN